MKIFDTKKLMDKQAKQIARKVTPENKILVKLNNVLKKIVDVENDKADILRLVSLYLETGGKDIKLSTIVKRIRA